MNASVVTGVETLDRDALLAPISEDAPAGVDLRDFDGQPQASGLYLALKDARNAARAKERAPASADADRAVPDTRTEWGEIAEQAQTLLRERSKDVEVAAWLVEAMTRLHGFAGLRDGLRLVRELLVRYWESCYPALDEEGPEYRLAPLAGLNGLDRDGTLIVPILSVPIVSGRGEEAFGTWRYQQAVDIQQTTDPEQRNRRIDAGGVTLEQLEREASETPDTFFRETFDALSTCIGEHGELTRELDERCGAQSPPSSKIRHALEACATALRYVGKRVLDRDEGKGATELQPAAGEAVPAAAAQSEAAHDAAQQGPITRDKALRQLSSLAVFFRRTEPHSPLSYAIEQVVRWGRMPLPELLEELVDEDSARSQIFRLAGIRSPDQAE